MKAIRKVISIVIINQNPKSGLKLALKKLMEHSGLKEAFIKVCTQNWRKDNKNYGIREDNLNATINLVYEMIIPKVIHAFAEPVVRLWLESKITKDAKVGFRPGLQAGVAAKGNGVKAASGKKSASCTSKGPKKITPDSKKRCDDTNKEQPNDKKSKTDATTEFADLQWENLWTTPMNCPWKTYI